jgi:DNA-binding NarL/FixJ family response regulator
VEPTRLAIADDNPDTIRMVADLLGPDFVVVKSFAKGTSALNNVQQIHPDILILEISLVDLSGLELLEELALRHSSVKAIVLTVYEDVEFVRAAFDAGASGYVFKTNIRSDLPLALQAVVAGQRFVPPPLRSRL